MTVSAIHGPAVPARTGVVLLARVRGGTGALLTAASLSSIAYTVTDLTDGTTLGTGTFATSTAAGLVRDDPRWGADDESTPGEDGEWGYNWSATLPGSLFALSTAEAEEPMSTTPPSRRVRCDVAFTPASGEAFRVSFEWEVVRTYG